jgi:hypothetical protein
VPARIGRAPDTLQPSAQAWQRGDADRASADDRRVHSGVGKQSVSSGSGVLAYKWALIATQPALLEISQLGERIQPSSRAAR